MRRFILGTDWWTDCDDAVALRLLARAVKSGEAALDGIVINACMEYSAASVDGFLQKEGLEGIPLGLDREATDFGRNPPYQKRLSAYATRYLTNDETENAVCLYRRLLWNADEPLELIEIGYLQALVALLESEADDICPLDGRTLVSQRVSRVWVMAGKWDRDGERENNFCRNDRARNAAAVFCRVCPVSVTFLGWEVGHDVITGGKLSQGDHLYDVLCDHRSFNGRSSWDPMLVLLALVGDEEKAGYRAVRGRAEVDAETGSNFFTPSEDGPHCYVIKTRDNRFYQDWIDTLIASE